MTDDTLPAIIRRFAASECSWLNTVRPSGRVHSAPVWHVWVAGRAYVVVRATAVKTANIRANPSVTITHPDPLQVIIIEGTARPVEGRKGMLRPYFQAKYDWDIVTDEAYDVVIEITPTKLLAWGSEGAGQRTRWTGDEVTAVRLD